MKITRGYAIQHADFHRVPTWLSHGTCSKTLVIVLFFARFVLFVYQEYQANLSRIRSFLAGTRNRSTLTECDRLLQEAKRCAVAMQGVAEVEGNAMRVTEARLLLERDIGPLAKEVQRALNEMGREELFYQSPNFDMEGGGATDMDSLIQSSEDLLRESQSVLMETEYIGSHTLNQMSRQREQLSNASHSLQAVQNAAGQAGRILKLMSRRACQSRLALYVMIATLGALNLFVLYRIYKKNHHVQAPPTGA